MSDVSADPWEFVADDLPASYQVPRRDLEDPSSAALELKAYLLERADAILEKHRGEPALLLSGGIDSIVTGATLVACGARPTCVTVIGDVGQQSDLERAEEAASSFNLKHEVVFLDDASLRHLIQETVDELGVDELWEVTAAVPIKAAFSRLAELGLSQGPVFTGGGADVLLGGGEELSFAPEDERSRVELEGLIWKRFKTRFIRERQIPDFYERILGPDAARLFHMFQTRAAWEATCRLSPKVLFQARRKSMFDKAALRYSAELLGVPAELAWTSKEPLQVSSGVIGSLERLSRRMVSEFPGSQTYSDPLEEPCSQVLARWAIREVARNKP